MCKFVCEFSNKQNCKEQIYKYLVGVQACFLCERYMGRRGKWVEWYIADCSGYIKLIGLILGCYNVISLLKLKC